MGDDCAVFAVWVPPLYRQVCHGEIWLLRVAMATGSVRRVTPCRALIGPGRLEMPLLLLGPKAFHPGRLGDGLLAVDYLA